MSQGLHIQSTVFGTSGLQLALHVESGYQRNLPKWYPALLPNTNVNVARQKAGRSALDTVPLTEDPEVLSEESQATIEATYINARPEAYLFINNAIGME